MSAVSSLGYSVSFLRTWTAFDHQWFADSVLVFPLTCDIINGVGALLKKGGYTSAASCYSVAKDRHIDWTEFLNRGVRSVIRAPARQSAELDAPVIVKLAMLFVLALPGAPLRCACGKRAWHERLLASLGSP